MSQFQIFSQNGTILPIAEATISLLNIEYSYGYGVYETLKVRKNKLYFIDYHVERLEHSAKTLEIPVPYSKETINTFLTDFVTRLNVESCNIKILLIGGTLPALFMFASAPLFPEKKLYTQGASMITYMYERPFPTAKTLNMLPSYMAYKKAKEHGCYDALLIDKQGILLEGTRTNFCTVKGNTIFRAPSKRVLEGVTFLTLSSLAEKEGFTIVEKEIHIDELPHYDGAFITSTSTKVMPIRQIDTTTLHIPDTIRNLMRAYEHMLDTE